MPYLSHRLWSTVFSYLPEEEILNATRAVDDLEENDAQRLILRAKPEVSPKEIFYPHITRSTNLSFVYFNSPYAKALNNTFKFHISIFPEDYDLVLYKSGLNQLLQDYLISPTAQGVLKTFKYVDPIALQKAKADEVVVNDYLLKFYRLIEQHNSLSHSEYSAKFSLYTKISAWHDWFIKNLGASFTKLNPLLEASPSELAVYKKKGFALIQEIDESIKRLEQEVQYTLYINVGTNTDQLITFIKNISEFLAKLGIRSVTCPKSDLPLTNFVTFRQERYSIDGEYISVEDEQSLKLKEEARDSECYKELVGALIPIQLKEEQEPLYSFKAMSHTG